MATWWAVDPQTGRGVPLNDAAAKEAAAEGWTVTQYDNQDGGIGQYGIDPNANAPHQITTDKVLVYNANTQRYEWMSQALVAAQQAATGQYGAETQRAATMADIIAASRGPENAFQYSNALHGAADASGVGIFDALAGRLGGSTTAGTPRAEDLHPIDIMGRVKALLARSMGTGGENGSGSSAWADQSGMAPTQKEQQAQGAAQDAATGSGNAPSVNPAGTGPAGAYGTSGVHTGTVVSDTTGNAGRLNAEWAANHPTPLAQTGSSSAHMTAYGPSSAVYDTATGKVDTGAYAKNTASGSGSSKITHVNKSHNLIESYGYGHGSDARNAAHKAAGMSGEEFDRIVKHGGDPFKKNQATGGFSVVDHPQTVHVGEGGKPEAMMVWPLARPDQPPPPAIASLANAVGPDHTMRMAAGGGVAALPPDPMVASPMPDSPPGMGAPPTDPLAGGASTPVGAGGFDPTSPQQAPEALRQIAALLATPPSPTDGPVTQAVRANWALGRDGQPTFVGGDLRQTSTNVGIVQPTSTNVGTLPQSPSANPDGSVGMAAGGGLAVIGGGTTVTQANKPANAAGQVVVPYNRGHRTVPVGKTTPLPNFGNLPPALLSLISPSDWKLIGSQYGAAGGNAADIPFLLQRSLQGLGRAPGAFGGRVF